MSNSDKDLLRFFKDYPVFSKWSEDKNLRQLPRHRHESRLKQKFSVEEYLNKLKLSSEYKDKNVKSILFAHFSPFEYEMEALGLPCYARKFILPMIKELGTFIDFLSVKNRSTR